MTVERPPAELAAPEHLHHAYEVLSAASVATVDLIEIVRGGEAIPAQVTDREVVENLASALQSAILIEAADTHPDVERQLALGELAAAVTAFLQGWA